MRWQFAFIGLAALAIAGWLVFQPRSTAPDLVVARDKLVAGDAVVAEFSPGHTEGYRFTVTKDLGWVWERTSGTTGEPLADAVVFVGNRYLLRITEACFIQLPAVKPPLVPGLTVAQKLVNQRGVHDTGGTLYAYDIEASAFARSGATLAAIRVTEDLAPLRQDGPMRASTGEPPGVIWPGDYAVRRATSAEESDARAVLRAAVPSDYGEIVIRERIVGTTILNNAILGPYRIVIPEACPDHPTLLSANVEGGQSEGLWSSPSPLRFAAGTPALIDRAAETQLKFRAPVEAFNAAAQDIQLGSVPVTSTSAIIARINAGGLLAIQIDSCTSRPWFVC